MSALFVLWFTRQAGGTEVLNGVEGGAQEMKVVGGLQQVSLGMADELGGMDDFSKQNLSIIDTVRLAFVLI